MGKKEEQDEKKATKLEEKAEEKEMKKEAKEEKHGNLDDSAEPAPLNAAAVAARVLGAPVVPVEGSTTVMADEPAQPVLAESGVDSTNAVNRENMPKPNKRNSLFGGLFNKKDTASPPIERTEKDVGPTVPVKDAESTTVSATAPQLTEPVNTSLVQTAEPAQESVPGKLDTTATPTAADAPIQKFSPTSKGSIFGFMKQKDPQHGVSQLSHSTVSK